MSEELGTEPGSGYRCRHCGTDLRLSLANHCRSCPNFTMIKPLAKIAARADAQQLREARL
jgi:lipopolysaccharide biosynthesis regulator YciM